MPAAEEIRSNTKNIPASGVGNMSRRKPPRRVPLKADTRVEAYRIEKVVGYGSFSIVYRGQDCRSGERVIVKEYYPGRYARRCSNNQLAPYSGTRLLAFAEGFRQFLNEALALERVSHPNVLDARDFLHANNTAYLISLDKGGRCLKWFIETTKEKPDQALLLRIFLPVMSALNYMHDARLLHLDIKPNNILLQPSGEPLVLDFGAARIMNGATWENRQQTLTRGFAPPEQFDKSREPGPWSDIYSLGAALYFCIAGKLPARATDNCSPELDLKIFESRFEPGLLKAINKSLSFDPADRYLAVDDFAEAMLEKTGWSDLRDYELNVMGYDRYVQATRDSRDEVLRLVA